MSKFGKSLVSLLLVGCFLSVQAQEQPKSTEAIPQAVPTEKIKVALLVPSKEMPQAAQLDVFKQGVLFAYAEDKDKYELVQYEASNTAQVLDRLNQAADEKAMLVIGPVLKGSVDAIAQLPYLPLPVVAINRTSSETAPDLFMSVDLTIESEVDQLVDIAIENTTRNPTGDFVVLATANPYDERVARAIVGALQKKGQRGEIRHIASEQLAYLRTEMRGKAFRGAIFAMNSQNASLLRPYLPPELAVFATSYTNPNRSEDQMAVQTQSNDLVGLVTLEIPAVSEKNKAQFALYRDSLMPLDSDAKKLFAIGVDAWKVGKLWLEWQQKFEIPEGLSGRIYFDKAQSSASARLLDKTVVQPKKLVDEDVAFEEDAKDAGL